jgi:hypothetical protein
MTPRTFDATTVDSDVIAFGIDEAWKRLDDLPIDGDGPFLHEGFAGST